MMKREQEDVIHKVFTSSVIYVKYYLQASLCILNALIMVCIQVPQCCADTLQYSFYRLQINLFQ